MRIQSNTAAMTVMRHLAGNIRKSGILTERLSSGYRINRAADDAAGMYISEKMRAQIRGLRMAVKNAHDGLSMLQTAEGGLQSAHDILQRMRELAVQYGSDTNADQDRTAIRNEIDQLTKELDRIAHTTEFNTKRLLDGSLSANAANLQVGANPGRSHTVGLYLDGVRTDILGLTSGLVTDDNSVPDDAEVRLRSLLLHSFDNDAGRGAVKLLDDAIAMVSKQRSAVGAAQNRLELTISNLEMTADNLAAAESRIRDLDMAKEMVEFVKTQILIQVGYAVLAHVKQQPQLILQLLR